MGNTTFRQPQCRYHNKNRSEKKRHSKSDNPCGGILVDMEITYSQCHHHKHTYTKTLTHQSSHSTHTTPYTTTVEDAQSNKAWRSESRGGDVASHYVFRHGCIPSNARLPTLSIHAALIELTNLPVAELGHIIGMTWWCPVNL